MKWSLILIGCLGLVRPSYAQSSSRVITVESEIVWAGVDRPGDLFVELANGDVQKYDKQGKRIAAHHFASPPTLLDPLDGVQSFYYSRTGHHYGTLSYDFTTVKDNVLDPSFAINPWLVCPALRELWILDSADFSIKKTRMNAITVSLETTLKHLPEKKMADFISLREYQNYVFLLDRSAGVHMFNSLGQYVRTVGEKGMDYFNFLGEEMYYVSGKDLVFIDLYTQERRAVPLPSAGIFALLNEDSLYLIQGKTISILPFQP